MSAIPEVVDRENALREMLEGRSTVATAAEVRAGIEAARQDRDEDPSGGIFGPRELGFGYVKKLEPGPDHAELLFVVTDGQRDAAIVVRLTGTLLATLAAHDEAPVTHPLERLRSAAGSLPNDGRRYENIVLNHPLGFSA